MTEEGKEVFDKINEITIKLSQEIDEKQTTLSNVNSLIQVSNDFLKSLKTKVEGKTFEIEAAIEKLDFDLKQAQEELAGRQAEVEKLTRIKGELMAENAKLSTKNAEMTTYESRVMKVLQAKENSLNAREEALIQRENLKPRTKSIL